jgi:chromosome segregation ATPase
VSDLPDLLKRAAEMPPSKELQAKLIDNIKELNEALRGSTRTLKDAAGRIDKLTQERDDLRTALIAVKWECDDLRAKLAEVEKERDHQREMYEEQCRHSQRLHDIGVEHDNALRAEVERYKKALEMARAQLGESHPNPAIATIRNALSKGGE